MFIVFNFGAFRKHYLTLLAAITEQMLFDGKGIDPDFRGRYKVNIERILASFVDDKKLKSATDELGDAKAKTDAANKENQKLDGEWGDKFGTTSYFVLLASSITMSSKKIK